MGLYYNPIPPHIGAQQPLTPRKLTPPISGPALTVVQFAVNENAAPLNVGLTATQAGDFIVCAGYTDGTITGLQSNLGDKAAFQVINGVLSPRTFSGTKYFVAVIKPTAGVTTVTLSISGSTFSDMGCYVIRGAVNLAIDKSLLNDVTSPTTLLLSGLSGTLAYAQEFALSLGSSAGAVSSINTSQTGSGAFTLSAAITGNGTGYGHQVTSSNTQIQGAWNTSNNNGTALIATFFDAGPVTPKSDQMHPATVVAWAVAASTAAFPYHSIVNPPERLLPQVVAASFVPPGDRMNPATIIAWNARPVHIAEPNYKANNAARIISGPPPQDPPFMGGDSIHEATLATWWLTKPHIAEPNYKANNGVPAAPVVASFVPPGDRMNPATPINWILRPFHVAEPNYKANNAAVPLSGPPPQDPPFMGGALMHPATPIAWLPKPPQPILAINLDPPISGPLPPDNPPFPGARVPVAVQVSWLPKPPQPIVAANLDPPISGPVTYRPVGTSVPTAVMVSWLPKPPMPIVAVNLDPPRSGPVPQNPPRIGARVPVAVQVSWLPQPPRPITPPKLGIATAPLTGVLATTEAADTAQFVVQVRSDAPGILNFGRRVTINRW